MAARTILVTPEELEATATKIETLATDYQTQYTALYKKTGDLATTYEGDDYTAFTNQIAGFQDDLKNMYDLMNQYAEFLRKAAKAYRDTQQNVITQIKRLAN